VNAFLESMFTSLRSGVVVLDRDLNVLVWNRQADDLWGVRAEEAERASFLSLDIGLPLAPLAQPLRACVSGTLDGYEAMLPALNRRGRAIVCKTTLYPLVRKGDDGPRGVIVMMDEQPDGVSPQGDGDGAAQARAGKTTSAES
jgi:two-component system CheB/CheR fusion protein